MADIGLHEYQMFTQDDLPHETMIRDTFPRISNMGVALIQNALEDGYAILIDSEEMRRVEFMYSFPECWLIDASAASDVVALSKSMKDNSALSNIGDLISTPRNTKNRKKPTYHILYDVNRSYDTDKSSFTSLTVRPTRTPAIPIISTQDENQRYMQIDIETATAPLDSIQAIYCRDFVGYHDGATIDKSVHKNTRRRSRPATFGSMADYPHLIKAFITAKSEYPVIKDLVRDYPQLAKTGEVPTILAGISMRDTITCDTKQELLHRSFRREIPKVANKCHIGIGILAAGVSPRFSDKAKARLWQNAQNIDAKTCDAMLAYTQNDHGMTRFFDSTLNTRPQSLETKKAWHDAVRESALGYALVYPKLANIMLERTYSGIQARDELKDLSDMLYKMHKQKMPDTINSIRRLREHHQNAQHAYRKIENQNLENEVLDVTGSPYKAVDEALAAVGFERMTNALQMYEEGERMHHCVFTYKDRMLDESSAFYTGVIDNERHTLQVTLTEDGPLVNQMYRKYDEPRTEQAKKAVDTALEISQMPKAQRGSALEALIDRITSAEAKGEPVTYTTTDLLKDQTSTAEYDVDVSVTESIQNQSSHIGEDLRMHQNPTYVQPEQTYEGEYAFNNPAPYDVYEDMPF